MRKVELTSADTLTLSHVHALLKRLGQTAYAEAVLRIIGNIAPVELAADESEIEVLRDMLDDARRVVHTIRAALGVPYEPHQSLIERILEAARHARRWIAVRDQDIESRYPSSGVFVGRIPQNEILTGKDADAAADYIIAQTQST